MLRTLLSTDERWNAIFVAEPILQDCKNTSERLSNLSVLPSLAATEGKILCTQEKESLSLANRYALTVP